MSVNLTPKDIADLKKKGYSEEEIQKAVQEIEKEDLEQSKNTSQDPRTQSRTSSFSSKNMDDIARYQLELNDLLDQTEHILRGDIIRYENGVKIWKDNPNPEKNPLNEEGIRKIMSDLQNYVNRHIILGDYEDSDINRIMKDYGRKLANLIFMKYEEMGMDTEEKRQEYQSIVMNIVNLVYASYSRAKSGGERRSLREMINTGYSYQTQPPQQVQGNERKRGIFNPMRYIGGKYG